MYLTRMTLHSGRRATREALASPQMLHACVLNCWPEPQVGQDRGGGRVLWRVDPGNPNPDLYIASPSRPDLTAMVEEMGWPASDKGWGTKGYDAFLDRLDEGQRWRFRLTANPTRRATGPSGRKVRVPHVGDEFQTRWLIDRAGHIGAEGVEARVMRRETLNFRRQNSKVTLATATFGGVLTVADPERLRLALINGIGPAKGYGCGLMTLAR